MKKIKATLTLDQIHSLKNQTFTDSEPGTLLKDFSSLLDFIGPIGILVSGKNHLIAIKLLPQLNQLMSHPLDVTLKRPQQKSFPHINGLYLLLRASGLTQTLRDRSRVVPRSDRACVFTKRFMRSENAGFTTSRRVIA